MLQQILGERILLSLETSHCNITNETNLIFMLNHSVAFGASANQSDDFCLFESLNVTITSTTDQIVKIYCDNSSATQGKPTLGFAFVNSTVTIKRIEFVKCGIYLKSLPNNIANMLNNSSPLYYPSTYATALLFLHSQVKMDEVVMRSSYGFAIIGSSLKNSSFESSLFTSSVPFVIARKQNITIGSGLLLHFSNSTVAKYDHHIKIFNCTFSDNYIYNFFNSYCANSVYGDSNTEKHLNPILASAALSVFYTNKTYQAQVLIQNCKFLHNVGNTAGSVLIVHYHSTEYDSTEIINSTFLRKYVLANIDKCSGSAEFSLILKNVNRHQKESQHRILRILEITFHTYINSKTLLDMTHRQGSVYFGVFGQTTGNTTVHILCSRVNCSNNKAVSYRQGVCFTIDGTSHKNLFVEFESVTLSDNVILSSTSATSSSGIITSNGANLIISGTKQGQSLFQNNFGSVFHGIDTNISLCGYVTFKGNRALSGAAINLQSNSHLHFMKGSKTSFEQNQAATFGGAIYAVVNKMNEKCAFIFNTEDYHDTNITFLNNSALNGGSSIYASPIFNCSIDESSKLIKRIEHYNKWFNFKQQSYPQLNMSTKPSKLRTVADKNKQKINVFPGEKFDVCLSAEDAFGQNVYASVTIHIALQAKDFHSSVFLQYKNTQQVVSEGINCTNLTLSFHSFSKHWTTEPITKDIVFQLISNQDISVTLYSVSLYKCPLGFSLHESSGSCGCSEALYYIQKYTSIRVECDIQTQTFTRLTNSWAGVIMKDNHSIFAISSYCSIGYCQANDKLRYFYSNIMNGITLKETHSITAKESPQCVYERDGPLCGQCSNGRSAVLGSYKCYHCSDTTNYWLFSLLFIIAGPILICLLYTLKLTLSSGTLNGIVFYANVMNCGKSHILIAGSHGRVESTFGEVMAGFLQFLNLDLGFPLCFYRDMGEMWKPGVSLLFPIYLLLLAIIIIILSHYSTWLSNRISHSSMQVLVTVIHFSFAKLLLSIIQVFSYISLFTSEGIMRVWYHDGTVLFLQDSRHLVLVIVCSLIVFPIVIFYLAFLLFTKSFSKYSAKCSLYLRPIHESIHGPFKEGKECFFVIRLLTLILICLAHFSEIAFGIQTANIVTILLLVIVLIGQITFTPYKSRVLNLLDNWSLINLILAYSACFIWYTKIKIIALATSLTTGMMFVTFVMVIVYHLLFVTGLFLKIKVSISKCIMYFHGKSMGSTVSGQSSTQNLLKSVDSYNQPCDQYRELLLDS